MKGKLFCQRIHALKEYRRKVNSKLTITGFVDVLLTFALYSAIIIINYLHGKGILYGKTAIDY